MNFAHKISATGFLSDIILFGRHWLFIQCLVLNNCYRGSDPLIHHSVAPMPRRYLP